MIFLKTSKNPYDIDGDIAKKILNQEQILGDTSKFLDIPKVEEEENNDNPCIYIFSTGFDSSQMNAIASYVKGIYRKQSMNDYFKMEVKVISPKEHFGAENYKKVINNTTEIISSDEGKAYGRNETYVELIYLDKKSADKNGDPVQDEVYYSKKETKNGKELYIPFAIVTYNDLKGEINLYRLAYRIAHEALHAFIGKAVFYYFGEDTFDAYRRGEIDELGQNDGHIYPLNPNPKSNDDNVLLNLNVGGLISGGSLDTEYQSVLRDTEQIVQSQKIVLVNFFYRWMKNHENIKISTKNSANYDSPIFRKIL